jgi:hypothetical protein
MIRVQDVVTWLYDRHFVPAVRPLDASYLMGLWSCTQGIREWVTFVMPLLTEAVRFPERAAGSTPEVMVTMATTAERVEQLLALMRDIDLPTLLALDRRLHSLLEQKGEENPQVRQGATAQAEFCQRYAHLAVDPDLFALVGRHPGTPVEADKALIREVIARRLRD